MASIFLSGERKSPSNPIPPGTGDRDIPAPEARKAPLHVLVVDDEPLIRWSVSETLADLGMDVEQAFDGASAIQCASKAKAYDVILLDLRLPDVNDLSLLARLRVMAPNAMVILMTAFGTPEVTEEALRLGAFKVVYKPFELRDIAELVTTTRAAGH